MSEPATPPDSTPAAPPTPAFASAKNDPVEAAEAHIAKLDMAKQRAIVKNLTK